MSSEVSYKDEMFDHVIFACHGDQVLPILRTKTKFNHDTKTGKSQGANRANGSISFPNEKETSDISEDELEIFSAFQTTENVCYLHSDLSLMPTRRQTWSSWNYLIQSQPSELKHPAGVSLTYDMNILQHISEDIHGPVLVTMNPGHRPKPELTQGKFIYRHPLYTVEAVRAQKRLQSIQNQRGVSYCGAWTKYGFHEDGFSSGLKVAVDHLDAELPFEFKDSTYSRGHRPELNVMDHLLRLILLVMLLLMQCLEWTIGLPAVSSLVRVIESFGSSALDTWESRGILK